MSSRKKSEVKTTFNKSQYLTANTHININRDKLRPKKSLPPQITLDVIQAYQTENNKTYVKVQSEAKTYLKEREMSKNKMKVFKADRSSPDYNFRSPGSTAKKISTNVGADSNDRLKVFDVKSSSRVGRDGSMASGRLRNLRKSIERTGRPTSKADNLRIR